MQTEKARHGGVALGQAPSDKPALNPYRGNPPYGILGGMMETSASCEAPVRAIVLPDRAAQDRAELAC